MPKARDVLLPIHRWVGLVVGLPLTAVAITGLAMVFRPQLEPLVDGALRTASTCAAPAPVESQARAARAVHGDGPIRQVEIAAAEPGATVVRFVDLQEVYVDPCGARVLGERHRWGGFFNTVEQIHRWRWIDDVDVAETLAGSLALVLATMATVGLFLWWPATRRQWKSTFRLRLSLKGAAFENNLHRTAGACAALVLIATTLAALPFTFAWARSGINLLTASPAPMKKPASPSGEATAATLDALLAGVLEAAPLSRTVTLVLPRKAHEPVEAQVIERDAPHPNAKTLVYLDGATAQVLRAQPYATSSSGNKVYRWLSSLHTAAVGGLTWQVILFAAVLMVPVLAWTGISLWLRRRLARMARTRLQGQSA